MNNVAGSATIHQKKNNNLIYTINLNSKFT